MPKEHLPVYQIQDFKAQAEKESYFYFSLFKVHLKEHLFIREPHKHNFYIILLINQGTGTHTIDLRSYEVRPNMIFFLSPGQVHSWTLSEDADGLVIFFSSEFNLKELPHKNISRFPFFHTLLRTPVLYISQEEKYALMPNLQALQKEYLTQGLMRNEVLSCYLNILLIYLTRIYQSQGEDTQVPGGELSLLQRLENLITQHYRDHLPITFYADQLHVTARYLTEVCKRSLG
ncbi:AraC family ligand binding domain-containing protein [Pontibacter toksunensis]|uniref:AraC family ligand binding domain-containing protein n=1 Tax=Pontibacter toksunensis TaxID=1332631 RepID=A0ABW6BSD4_9BACT